MCVRAFGSGAVAFSQLSLSEVPFNSRLPVYSALAAIINRLEALGISHPGRSLGYCIYPLSELRRYSALRPGPNSLGSPI